MPFFAQDKHIIARRKNMKVLFTYSEYCAVSYSLDLIDEQCTIGDDEFTRRMKSTQKALRRIVAKMRREYTKECAKNSTQHAHGVR